MPVRPAAPGVALRPAANPCRSRARRTTRRWLPALVGCAVVLVPAGQASAAELLTNGGFETGDFTGWTTTQLASPYTPWVVADAAHNGGRSIATPQEGSYDAMNGFDGGGPGTFTLSQVVDLPTGSTVLSWQDRIQYQVFGQPRLLDVKLLDPATDAVLATLYSFTTSGSTSGDTGWQTHSIDISAHGGQTVKLHFEETIPENYTGPGQIEFDAISLETLFSASPTSLVFGPQDAGDGATGGQESILKNATGAPVALSGLTFGGADPAQFGLRGPQAGDCTSTTVLAAAETCVVGVTFDPEAAGAKAATLTISSDEPDVTIALAGTATQRELSPSPSVLEFGSRDVDEGPTASAASSITNSGTGPVALTALTLAGDAAGFARLNGEAGDCSTTTVLAEGEACDVRVRFDPTVSGAQAATLTVASDAAAILVALRGSGTQQAAPVVTAPPVVPPAPAAAPTPPPVVAAAHALPAKLALRRATIDRGDRVLDVLASITSLASGRVAIELRAAGRTFRFTAPIDATTGRVRVRQRIPAAQARLGTGIVTISYAGDEDTRPQTVRLRSAADPAALKMERPRIVDGRVTASGTVNTPVSGVVRLLLEYDRGGETVLVPFQAPIADGRWSLDESIPAATAAEMVKRRGTVHSSTLFTGSLPERMRGEMRSFQVLPAG